MKTGGKQKICSKVTNCFYLKALKLVNLIKKSEVKSYIITNWPCKRKLQQKQENITKIYKKQSKYKQKTKTKLKPKQSIKTKKQEEILSKKVILANMRTLCVDVLRKRVRQI